MQILAIDKLVNDLSPEKMQMHLLDELKHTVSLYLSDKIRTFYFRKDRSGVVFIMECESLSEAEQIIESLPFVKEKLLDFDLIPIGPLKPLRLLLNNS